MLSGCVQDASNSLGELSGTSKAHEIIYEKVPAGNTNDDSNDPKRP